MEEETAFLTPAAKAPAAPPGPRVWIGACTAAALLCAVALLWWSGPVRRAVVAGSRAPQHIYIIRHGEKLVDCRYPNGNRKGPEFGNNSPLTARGYAQAQVVAEWLRDRDVRVVLTSPFARAQQTALATAEALGLPVRVDHRLSEERVTDGPYRLYSTRLRRAGVVGSDAGTPYVGHMEALRARRAPAPFAATEIWVPEGDAEYYARIADVVADLAATDARARLRGNVAIFTHAMTAWSLCYGLTRPLWESAAAFHNRTAGMPPAGVFHVVLDVHGAPVHAEGPLDFATRQVPSECTRPHTPKTVRHFWDA